jgi:hypothetical protein
MVRLNMLCRSRQTVAAVALLSVLLIPYAPGARHIDPKNPDKGLLDPDRVLVLDGSNIHNAGELQMHVSNWGEFGSRPHTARPYSWGPSAQWPAGSGVEYLFTAGLWVGALDRGVPAVSTAAYDTEFRPSQDSRDIVYRASEGDTGGNRLPHPEADDDGDGLVDEDWLDGYDNDDDGLIDEDFAAVSRQMFSCRYTDNQPITRQIHPEHNPLNIMIRQESYQWSAGRYDDFVAVEYHITNIGSDILENVYVGLFVDGDAGPRERANYWEDDLVARVSVPVTCTDIGPVAFDFAYTHDADGDDGRTPGRFGVVVLDYTTDPLGITAPQKVEFTSFCHFSGHQSFEAGGDPTNDFERYELLSQGIVERDAELPRDYRMLINTGPFSELLPDSTLALRFAFVVGAGEKAFRNAASTKLAYQGKWFDFDKGSGIPTGYEGQETPVYGPLIEKTYVDPCRIDSGMVQGCDFPERRDRKFNFAHRHLEEGEVLWTNADCAVECFWVRSCGYTIGDSMIFRTGVDGRETQVHWILAMAPPPPQMRIVDHDPEGVVVYWDNSSELARDAVTQLIDFEGYQVWRADGWTRPLGTSTATGPPSEMWTAIAGADIINGVGEDAGLDHLRYEPLNHLLTPVQKRDFLNTMRIFLSESPDLEPPCPQGVTTEVCDTLRTLARFEMGFAGGRQYYRYVDRSIHLGRPYFYSVVAFDRGADVQGRFTTGITGSPSSNFVYVEPKSAAQEPWAYDAREIYVVPNPATRESMAAWTLDPTNEDPSGTKVEFRNLPRAKGMIRIYTLAGDLVRELHFDGRYGVGTVKWDLVSRTGQDVTSGVYLYSVQPEGNQFERKIGKFTVIR